MEKLNFEAAQLRNRADGILEELKVLKKVLDPVSPHWKCDGCGYTKHFTKPATAEACGHCPRCKGEVFSIVPKRNAPVG